MKPAPAALRGTLALVAGLASLAAAGHAAHATPWYQVEVVIFAQGDESRWGRDDWREEGPPDLAENTVELLPGLDPADQPAGSKRRHAFRTLPAPALGLGAAVDRLDRSDDYRVLLHAGWHQPGFSAGDAPAVHLTTLRGVAAEERFTGAGAGGEEAAGTVRFWRRRFLHVDVDVAFGDVEAWRQREGGATPKVRPGAEAGAGAMPAAGPAAPTDANADREGGGERLRVVRLTRSLRLRSGRLHYIDHPLFGVLLEVRRLD